MITILLIVAGGAIGAVLRYLTAVGTARLIPGNSVLTGTVMANVIGCFLAGALFALYHESALSSHPLISFLTIGILGSYTTFSTFSLELFQSLTKSFKTLALYLFMQLVTALGAVVLGFYLLQRLMEIL